MTNKLRDKALQYFRELSRDTLPSRTNHRDHCITINFHPFKKTNNGVPILKAFSQDPFLRSQFETATSNGGLSAFEGGARWQWESRVFNQVYDQAKPEDRPKYGALNYLNHGSGASPRFGSAYFQLKPEVLERATFCYPDSYLEPDGFASYKTIATLMNLADKHVGDPLDNYIEAHIHGQLSLHNDVECLVLDPAFQKTDIETEAIELPVDIRWHKGFQLGVNELGQYLDYRGAQFVTLAKEIAEDSVLNIMTLARAEKSDQYQAQDIKKVWHYLACFGDLNKPKR